MVAAFRPASVLTFVIFILFSLSLLTSYVPIILLLSAFVKGNL
mgnify:CR=1 FL=1